MNEVIWYENLLIFAHLGPHLYALLFVWCIIGACLHDVLWDVHHSKWVELSKRGITDGICVNISFQRQEFILNERINMVPVDSKGNFGLPLGEYHLENSRFEFGTSVDGVVVLFHYFYIIIHISCLWYWILCIIILVFGSVIGAGSVGVTGGIQCGA